jgi:hypothetical protein
MLRSETSVLERQLALVLVGTHTRRERHRARIDELASQLSFSALEAFLLEYGMLALVGRRLLDVSDAAPESFAKRVEEYSASAQRQGVSQQMLTIRMIAALADAGVRALPLKGPLLGERIYGEPEARVSADIDLLVGASDLAQATELLEDLGYTTAPGADVFRSGRPDLHEVLCGPDGLPGVELHWRIHWHERHFSAEMLQRAAPGPEGCLCPRGADELIELLLFYARDGFAGIRLLADITAWWDRFGEELAPGEVEELARTHPDIAGAVVTSALVAERLGGLPARELFDRATLPKASGRAMRLSNWALRGRRGQIMANRSLIDWLLTPRGQRRQLLRRRLWPSEETLFWRWPEVARAAPRRLRPMWVGHLLLDCGRYTIALLRTRSDGEWAPVPRWLDTRTTDGD